LKTRKWQDDKGNDRYSTEIQCVDFTFLTAKSENAQPAGELENKNSITTLHKAEMSQEQPNDLPF
jgi:single-strand DNA-binding protein